MRRALILPLLLLLLTGCAASAAPLPVPPAGDPSVGAGAGQGTTAGLGRFTPGETRSHSGGAVDLAATVRTTDTDGTLKFDIGLNTHSVGLDGYNLSQLAMLRNGRGQEVKPTLWEAPAGGHHRSSTLVFPSQDVSGRALVEPGVAYVELSSCGGWPG
ncbi:MAG: hypothetical protein M1401_01560 [Chloroflexi bacterium]|nr:hypothetical protein [Chloroflexota bacterium]MCL5107564.1 hypothetical protein [Chloroflexota bacterium]